MQALRIAGEDRTALCAGLVADRNDESEMSSRLKEV
jgi:hypothetical protein